MATITIGRVLSSGQDSVTAVQGGAGGSPWPVKIANTLVPEPWDHVALGYNVNGLVNLAIYRLGGVAGAIVATINITYVGRLIATVTRT